MPGRRKPTALLVPSAFKTHPKRARPAEPKPTGQLGAPPDRLELEEKDAWFEIAAIAPANVLTNADRLAVEIASRLMTKLRRDGLGGLNGLGSSYLAQLIQTLGRLGLTPADRGRLSITAGKESDNPFDHLDDDEPIN